MRADMAFRSTMKSTRTNGDVWGILAACFAMAAVWLTFVGVVVYFVVRVAKWAWA